VSAWRLTTPALVEAHNLRLVLLCSIDTEHVDYRPRQRATHRSVRAMVENVSNVNLRGIACQRTACRGYASIACDGAVGRRSHAHVTLAVPTRPVAQRSVRQNVLADFASNLPTLLVVCVPVRSFSADTPGQSCVFMILQSNKSCVALHLCRSSSLAFVQSVQFANRWTWLGWMPVISTNQHVRYPEMTHRAVIAALLRSFQCWC
jgi:hypothetical protein